jgi:multiple sugar transport system substrate-binding protein
MGFDSGDFQVYIPAYAANLTQFPIYATYLRIPGTPAYWTALDIRLSEAMTGQKTAQQALNDTANDWRRITADSGDVKKLLNDYQNSIGYNPVR